MNTPSHRPLIGITAGDPKGIGPEIVGKILKSDLASKAQFKIFGPLDLDPQKLGDLEAAQITLQSLHEALQAAREKKIDALVTAPVNKLRLRQVDPSFTGHTEFFGNACSVKPTMLFVVPEKNFRVALVTRHMPLAQVAHQLNAVEILHTIRQLHAGLQQGFGLAQPAIAVTGLNPHAGEGGMLGEEEHRIIAPAIAMARKEGLAVEGPFPADTIFWEMRQGRFDAVVAMYHDQGLVAVKTLAFNEAVQVTLGLPFLRLSVDHGTAENIVGKNKADTSNLKAAILLACQMI